MIRYNKRKDYPRVKKLNFRLNLEEWRWFMKAEGKTFTDKFINIIRYYNENKEISREKIK